MKMDRHPAPPRAGRPRVLTALTRSQAGVTGTRPRGIGPPRRPAPPLIHPTTSRAQRQPEMQRRRTQTPGTRHIFPARSITARTRTCPKAQTRIRLVLARLRGYASRLWRGYLMDIRLHHLLPFEFVPRDAALAAWQVTARIKSRRLSCVARAG